MKDIIEYIANMEFNLSEANVLERLLDRKRFPRRYHDGFASVDVILDDGEKDETDFLFKDDGYLDTEKAYKHT
jgi:hypothetical protein